MEKKKWIKKEAAFSEKPSKPVVEKATPKSAKSTKSSLAEKMYGKKEEE